MAGWMNDPFAAGAIAVAGLWILGVVGAGAWNPLVFIEGADGRPSTSKLQWLMWLVAALFGYVAVLKAGHTTASAAIPYNMLLCLGFSTGTMAAAKAVTVSYLNTGRIHKRSSNRAVKAQHSVTYLLTDDAGVPDLSKLQMLAWTLLAIGAYVAAVIKAVNAASATMPDIDQTLMALMGLGHGGYLGKKVTSVGTDAETRDPFALLR